MEIKRYFIPETLDVAELHELWRPEYVEKLLFFISTIHVCRVANCSYKTDDFIRLKAHVLGNFIRGNDVARVRADLIRLGIIECDWDRVYHLKCYGHRLTEKYRGQRMTMVKAAYPKKCADKVEVLSKPQEYIRRNLKKVTIEPAAKEMIDGNYSEAQRELNDTYNYRLTAYHLISDGALFFGDDEKTGRVFHNVANCPREMRPYLRLDGREMVEIDISNSQPMLLACLYSDAHSAEAKRYRETVESGKFYEVLQAYTGYSREEAKKEFLRFAFFRAERVTRLGEAFKSLFPELRAIMDEIKYGNHRKLSILLQKLEADLVINSVVPICEQKGIPVLTIHDSLMVFPEHTVAVEAMLKAECQRLYNLCPCLKTKA